MKKINPKDLEVNPKNRDSNIYLQGRDVTDNTGLAHCETYACRTDIEECDTEVGVCYHVTDKTGCMCDTQVDCDYTKGNCPDPASKGIVCKPLSDRPTDCVVDSYRCFSKEICPATEDTCDSVCLCKETDDCGEVSGECILSVDMCIETDGCKD